MTITLRSEKGAPLTIEELDENFKELNERLTALEQGKFAVESLGSINVEGQEIVFTSTLGKELGRCALPEPSLQGRGNWRGRLNYCQGDIVRFQDRIFLCRQNHTSDLSPDRDEGNWKALFDIQRETSQEFEHSSSGSTSERKEYFMGSLPLYEEETLPNPSLGQIGVLLEKTKKPKLIFSNGKAWKTLLTDKLP